MRCVVFCLLMGGLGAAWAQTAAPSTEQMIQQLQAPRLRSLRNLTVEAVPPAAAAPSGASAATPVAAPVASAAPAAQPAPSPAAAPAAEPVPQAAAVADEQARPSLSLSIQFDFDSSRIRAESLEPLGNLAAALASPALLDSRFVIEGHTDAKGNAAYNRKLSAQRAAAVKDWLVAKGVDASRLQAAGKGSSEPAKPQDPLAAENRRVKIINLDTP